MQVTKKGARAKTKIRFSSGKGRPGGPFSDPGEIRNGSKIVLWSINRHPGPPKRPSGRGSGGDPEFDENAMRESPVFDGPEHTPALYSSIILQYRYFLKSPEISPGRAPESHPNRPKTRLGADPGRSRAPFVTFRARAENRWIHGRQTVGGETAIWGPRGGFGAARRRYGG